MEKAPIQSHQYDEDVLQRTIKKDGARALTDAEIIAILIGRGKRNEGTMSLSKALLELIGNDLHRLGRVTPEEMMRVHGIGERTAVNLLAALELGRRRLEPVVVERPRVSTSVSAHELLRPVLCDLAHEEFWLLLLDRGLRLIERVRVSMGGVHGTVADPKCIFKLAIDRRASCMVVAHNHPSGQTRPSEEDIRLTTKLIEGGRLLDVLVQDHVIVTDMGFYSFADQGQMR